ncbi:MAG: hypothetical protein ACLFVK_06650 [Dehalococcoidia bacterium]
MKITIESNQLTKDDLQVLLQAVRGCEQQHFKDKAVYIVVEAPELWSRDVSAIIAGIDPRVGCSPIVFRRR